MRVHDFYAQDLVFLVSLWHILGLDIQKATDDPMKVTLDATRNKESPWLHYELLDS
jgi:hypothetical protein